MHWESRPPADAGFATEVIEARGRQRAEHDAEIVSCLQAHQIDLVCLAGYMRLLSAGFVRAFPQRILNIHPSLLPAFPGLDAQLQALEVRGDRLRLYRALCR